MILSDNRRYEYRVVVELVEEIAFSSASAALFSEFSVDFLLIFRQMFDIIS